MNVLIGVAGTFTPRLSVVTKSIKEFRKNCLAARQLLISSNMKDQVSRL